MMTGDFKAAMAKVLAKGARDHGDASFSAEPRALIEEMLAETADIAVWGYILHRRSGTYPQPHGAFVRQGVEQIGVGSISLARAVAVLVAEMPYGERVVADELRRPPPNWLAWALVDGDHGWPRYVTGRAQVMGWMDVARARFEIGRVEYGDASYDRDGAELCLELADELLGLAGWAYVLRGRAAGFGRLDVVNYQLSGIVRASAALYARVRSVQYLCATSDAMPPEPPPYQLAFDAWLPLLANAERRIATHLTSRGATHAA